MGYLTLAQANQSAGTTSGGQPYVYASGNNTINSNSVNNNSTCGWCGNPGPIVGSVTYGLITYAVCAPCSNSFNTSGFTPQLNALQPPLQTKCNDCGVAAAVQLSNPQISGNPTCDFCGGCAYNRLVSNTGWQSIGSTPAQTAPSKPAYSYGTGSYGLAICHHGATQGYCRQCQVEDNKPAEASKPGELTCKCGNADKPKFSQLHSYWCDVYKKEF